MTSIYERLFTYRERPLRRPLEDFLTEALADLFNRFPDSIARSLVAFLLSDQSRSARSDEPINLSEFWPCGAEGKWITQCHIDNGIIDLLFTVDGKPLVVVENKIYARFQNDQLATYGRWIASQPLDGALVLLTHSTPAPEDFTSSSKIYHSKYRSVIRWTDLARWLSENVSNSGQDHSVWVALSADLVAFLRKNDMDHDLATSQDLEALQAYVSTADRVYTTIKNIWNGAADLLGLVCIQGPPDYTISTECRCAWMWKKTI